MKRTVSAKKPSRSSSSSIKDAGRSVARYAVCIDNEDYAVSLEIGKLYKLIPDRKAAAHGYLRVVDESGEDYMYAADMFFPVRIPPRLARRLASMRSPIQTS